MAIDHVRVYSGQPAGGPTPGIFFTRWITHFVAPAFLFLAGTGAYLYGQRVQRPRHARAISRDARSVARVPRAHGDSRRVDVQLRLRALSARRRDLDDRLVHGAHGGHRLSAATPRSPRSASASSCCTTSRTSFRRCSRRCDRARSSPLWKILYAGGGIQLGADGPPLVILFVLVPWIGVMAAGYAFGAS